MTPKTNPPKGHQENRCHCRPDQTPWGRYALEVAAVLVGGLVAYIYLGQLGEMIQSNKINREALEAVQRAFVFLSLQSKDVAPDILGADKSILEFPVVLENSGATPTKNLRYHVNRRLIQQPLPQDFDFPDEWTEGGRPSGN